MYDPEGAKKLLDEAGYPPGSGGIRLKADMSIYEFWDLDYFQLAAAYWKAIGVDARIDVAERSLHIARVREHNYGEMITWFSGGVGNSPVKALHYGYSTEKLNNPSGLNDPEFDSLFEAVRDAVTIEEQQRAAKAADMYLLKNHIYLWGPMAPKYVAVQPWLKGYNGEIALGGDDRMVIFSRFWFDQALKKEMGH